MIHYNKSGFSVECIECSGKFKSIMDEVINEMGNEINYANTDNHVPDEERKNRVIK